MIEMHSKYDNMHENGMFYTLICINNHVFACLDCMLSWAHGRCGATELESRNDGAEVGAGNGLGTIEVGNRQRKWIGGRKSLFRRGREVQLDRLSMSCYDNTQS